jgi:hypothetical protein
MKSFFSVLAAASLLAGTVQAREGRWGDDRRDDRFGRERSVVVGSVQIGRNNFNPSVLYVPAELQCRMTHIKLTAIMDSVVLTKIDVTYRFADRFGNNKDSIDLNDNDDFGRSRDRRGWNDRIRGISLAANQSSPWLDLDDVQDGFPDGRCITSIQVYGIDTPDFGRRGERPGRFGGPIRPIDRPATVQIEGIALRNGGGDNHRPPIVPTPPPRPPVVPTPPPSQPIDCYSIKGVTKPCYVGQNVRAVDIRYQASSASCNPIPFVPEQKPVAGSYAFDQRGGFIYVYAGCRASFNLYYR